MAGATCTVSFVAFYINSFDVSIFLARTSQRSAASQSSIGYHIRAEFAADLITLFGLLELTAVTCSVLAPAPSKTIQKAKSKD